MSEHVNRVRRRTAGMAKYVIPALIMASIACSSFYLEPRWAKAAQDLASGLTCLGLAAVILEAGSRQGVRWAWAPAVAVAFAAIAMLGSAYGLMFDFGRVALAATPPCLQRSNQDALLEVEPDSTLADVVSTLDGSYELRSRAGTIIDRARLKKIDYRLVQPVTLTRTVAGERLHITFGSDRKVTAATCKGG